MTFFKESLFALLLMVLAAVPGLGQDAAPPTDGPDAAAVRVAQNAWLSANKSRDAVAMSAVLAEGFIVTYADGSTQNRDQLLAALTQSGGGLPVFEGIENSRIRVYGDAAVVNGRYTHRQKIKDKGWVPGRGFKGSKVMREVEIEKEVRRHVVFTETYVRIGGMWRLAASHWAVVNESVR